jgi:hypothetical protein
MTQSNQFKVIQDLFHGNEKNGTMSQLQLLITAYEPYSALYDIRSDIPCPTNSGTTHHQLLLPGLISPNR